MKETAFIRAKIMRTISGEVRIINGIRLKYFAFRSLIDTTNPKLSEGKKAESLNK